MIGKFGEGFRDLLLAHTSPSFPPACPEIRTREATSLIPLWEAAEKLAGAEVEPPFWAYSWPGGQALARYVLDMPEVVRGKSVLDLGSGNGVLALAARFAGALRVMANDIDQAAGWMLELNAVENGLPMKDGSMEFCSKDLLSAVPPVPPFEVILAGDLFYSRDMAARVEAWLRKAATLGAEVLVGDPGRAYMPREGLRLLESYEIPVSPEIESASSRKTSVLRMLT
jgi:predicted nicotinamide N-methyase